MHTKIVAAAFIASLSLTWGIPSLSHYLQDAFFWKELSQNPEIAAAFLQEDQLKKQVLSERPTRREEFQIPSIEAKAAFSVLVRKDGNEKVLFTKNQRTALPIASLTKLMTALVAAQTYPLEKEIAISGHALATEGPQGFFEEEDTFSVKNLLYPLLMESSNDAAVALAEQEGEPSFVRLMNGLAEILRMDQTSFFNPTGLDPDEGDAINVSSARDLAILIEYLKDSHPEVFDILSLETFDLKDAEGYFHHTVLNTDELLKNQGFPTKILGGKTGYTEKASGCLIIVVQSPKDRGYIVNVVLGSDNRFEEMKKLIQFAYEGYSW
ncbi:MAG: hypothetical protein Q7S63_02405 [bacterium]|nr:hypothetical protein [bacterium]